MLSTETRSSWELKNQITNYLRQQGVSSWQRLNIDVNGGMVTLHGTVPSFYERQLCISCKRVAGVVRLVDNLKVQLRPKRTSEPEMIGESTRRTE